MAYFATDPDLTLMAFSPYSIGLNDEESPKERVIMGGSDTYYDNFNTAMQKFITENNSNSKPIAIYETDINEWENEIIQKLDDDDDKKIHEDDEENEIIKKLDDEENEDEDEDEDKDKDKDELHENVKKLHEENIKKTHEENIKKAHEDKIKVGGKEDLSDYLSKDPSILDFVRNEDEDEDEDDSNKNKNQNENTNYVNYQNLDDFDVNLGSFIADNLFESKIQEDVDNLFESKIQEDEYKDVDIGSFITDNKNNFLQNEFLLNKKPSIISFVGNNNITSDIDVPYNHSIKQPALLLKNEILIPKKKINQMKKKKKNIISSIKKEHYSPFRKRVHVVGSGELYETWPFEI